MHARFEHPDDPALLLDPRDTSTTAEVASVTGIISLPTAFFLAVGSVGSLALGSTFFTVAMLDAPPVEDAVELVVPGLLFLLGGLGAGAGAALLVLIAIAAWVKIRRLRGPGGWMTVEPGRLV